MIRKANFLVIFVGLFGLNTQAQNITELSLSIDPAGATADPSSLLEVKSSDRGILIPRMTETEMMAITSPAQSLLVFNTTQNEFHFYDGSSWVRVGGYSLFDEDNDTGISFNELTGNDEIRFYQEGSNTVDFIKSTGDISRFEFQLNNSNIAIGDETGDNITTAVGNIMIGENAGSSITEGLNSIIVGRNAGQAITTGDYNTIVGYQSGYSLTTSSDNTFIGNLCGRSNATGRSNTFLGSFAGYGNDDGDNSVAIGRNAAMLDDTMEESVYIGAYAGMGGISSSDPAVSREGNVFIGNQAGRYETGSDKLIIDNTDDLSCEAFIYGQFDNEILTFNADVGVGTDSPDADLEIIATSTSASHPNLKLNQTTTGSPARIRLQSENADNNYWGIYGVSRDNGSSGNADLKFFYDEGSLVVLELEGNGDATLAGTLTELSDARLKTNILGLTQIGDKLKSLSAYSYNWKDESKNQNTQIGLLAQEVGEQFPELVKENDSGFLSVNYSGFVPLLIQSHKEQMEYNEKLKTQVDFLLDELNELKAQIEE